MIIEVSGTNTKNKGAELMLVAIREHFAGRENVHLAVNQFFGSYEERARYGLLQKMEIEGWGWSRIATHLMPASYRTSFGLVKEREVDVLMDASGFAFGDQHPAERTVQFAERVTSAKRAGTPVILLPQALGPFTDPMMRDAFAQVLDAADLVFARDEISFRHASDVRAAPDTLFRAPDFTNLIQPSSSAERRAARTVAIVPNHRMIEKAEAEGDARAYVPFMLRCITAVAAVGLRPFLLIHEQDDWELARTIQEQASRDISIRTESTPVALKALLGRCDLVVGSRFHALVGALSQGVPAIGTSWSHKYEMLFQDYGCEEMLLAVSTPEEEIRQRACEAVEDQGDRLKSRIESRAETLRERTATMWERVDERLGLPSSARATEMKGAGESV